MPGERKNLSELISAAGPAPQPRPTRTARASKGHQSRWPGPAARTGHPVT